MREYEGGSMKREDLFPMNGMDELGDEMGRRGLQGFKLAPLSRVPEKGGFARADCTVPQLVNDRK